MKIAIFPLILFALALGLTTVIIGAEKGVPLPADLNIIRPDSKIPGASFSGIWEGTLITSTGPRTRPTSSDLCLAIEKINADSSLTLVYAIRTAGVETFERTTGKLSEPADEINFELKSGAKVNLFYNTSLKKIYVKYVRGKVLGDAVLSPRSQ